MPSPREVSQAERQAIWAEVQAEFPDDEMMREFRFRRALRSAILPSPNVWNT
jgi:hypothetical protein